MERKYRTRDHHWRADVRVVGELPFRHREQASRP